MIRLALLALFFIFVKQFDTFSQTPKFLTEVYDNLYQAAKNSEVGKPELTYDIKNEKQIVTYRSGRQGGTYGEIIVGAKFLDLMRSFGKDSTNALAFVLGHEMAHIFLKQTDYIESLGSGYADKQLKKSLKTIKDSLYSNVFERQADEHAAFYAHMAGYNTTEIGPAVLDAIYKEFNLPTNLQGYPALEERKLIARAAGNRMKVLSKIYDAANLAIAGGKYKMAKRLYGIILIEGFESSDIYNNCGVALTMLAIEADSSLQKYILPLFLDTESALDDNKLHRGIYDDPKKLLKEAREHFDKAASRNYPIATLNLGDIAFLLNDFDEALYCVKKAQKLGLIQSQTLLGIITHAEGDTKKAMQTWQSIELECPIAKKNLNLFYPKYASIPLKEMNIALDSLNNFDIDLVAPFFNKNFNARDSDTLFKILKTQVLQFYNTTIDDKSFFRFKIKGGEEDEIIHFAALKNFELEIREEELHLIADRIFLSNRYRYYRINNKVIKFFPNGEYEIYIIR